MYPIITVMIKSSITHRKSNPIEAMMGINIGTQIMTIATGSINMPIIYGMTNMTISVVCGLNERSVTIVDTKCPVPDDVTRAE